MFKHFKILEHVDLLMSDVNKGLGRTKSINVRRGELVLKNGQASLFLAAQRGGILWLIAAARRKLTVNQLTNQISRNRVYLQARVDPSGKILALKLARNLAERAAADKQAGRAGGLGRRWRCGCDITAELNKYLNIASIFFKSDCISVIFRKSV